MLFRSEHLDIDVTELKIGKSIKVGDLSFEGLELATSIDGLFWRASYAGGHAKRKKSGDYRRIDE